MDRSKTEVRLIPSATSMRETLVIVNYSHIGHEDSPLGHYMDLTTGVWNPIEDEFKVPPGIPLSRDMIALVTSALIDHCDRSEISLEKEDHLKGRMEAVEQHLAHSNEILDKFLKKYIG